MPCNRVGAIIMVELVVLVVEKAKRGAEII